MKKFITADTHFGHHNIIKYCNRPFLSTEQMDEHLLRNWNDKVAPEDLVIVNGDFAYGRQWTADRLSWFCSRLNGTIDLVEGNHDSEVALKLCPGRFRAVHQMLLLSGGDAGNLGWLHVYHYPLRTWYKSNHGSGHLFGHVHGRFDYEPWGRSMDVGVDSNEFSPLALDTVVRRLAATPARLPGAAGARD